MADHICMQVREAIVASLVGLPTTGNRVYASRVVPVEDSEIPCLLVALEEERITHGSVGYPRLVIREAYVTVKAVVKSNSNFDNKVDAIRLEVEKKLTHNSVLGGLAKDVRLEQTAIEFDGGGEVKTGQATMLWLVVMHTLETAPDVAL